MSKSVSTTFLLACLALILTLSLSSKDTNWISDKYEAGFITVNEERGHNLFFWAFYSRNDFTKDPVVLWLQGGPGASGALGLMYENGPFHLVSLGLNISTETNPYSWNSNATVIYIDSPVGTGYSYSNSQEDYYAKTTPEMMSEVYTFLQLFFQKFPQFSKQPFYIFGESYGGHYVPSLTSIILQKNEQIFNKQINGILINLQGIGIGNGWTCPIVQYKAYIEFSHMNGLIGDLLYDALLEDYSECAYFIQNNDTVAAAVACNLIVGAILAVNPGMSFYDIRIKCPNPLEHSCYDFSLSEEFLNMEWVKKMINVPSDRAWYDREVEIAVSDFADNEVSFREDVANALNNKLRVLLYSGEFDFAANYIGGEMWSKSMQWHGQSDFNNSATHEWKVDGNVAGWVNTADGLTWIKGNFGEISIGMTVVSVKDSGHMVPMYVPKPAQDMFVRFINNQPFY